MTQFLSENFLLESEYSKRLFYDYASKMPIIDYHNHLPPQDIAANRKFDTITEAWLEGDHYKWRAMRAFGIDEAYITGAASDEEKFLKWAEVVPYTIRNPLFHWTHLELRRYFEIDDLLKPENAVSIYHRCNEVLSEPSHSCNGLLSQMKVEVVCTTDDPADSLADHEQINQTGQSIHAFPTFRPDKIYEIGSEDYKKYLDSLAQLVGFNINSLDDLLEAAQKRMDAFHTVGGRLSDHSFRQLYDVDYSINRSKKLFAEVLAGKKPTDEESQVFKMTVLVELSKMYHQRGWAQQFHLGAIRNNNDRMMQAIGRDTGFDSIGDFDQIKGLRRFLSTLDQSGQLARTIIYNLNPKDNESFATMLGNFNDGSVRGKMQFGSGWWFLDQLDGMEKQLNALSNMGLLSCFVGMLTDSRSFLSFPRHEYFRRLLCGMIGKEMDRGLIPADLSYVGEIVNNICYYNAREYFNFET
ncbi:MAG: glucuronate isomerase [Bacteroidota bacterium]